MAYTTRPVSTDPGSQEILQKGVCLFSTNTCWLPSVVGKLAICLGGECEYHYELLDTHMNMMA